MGIAQKHLIIIGGLNKAKRSLAISRQLVGDAVRQREAMVFGQAIRQFDTPRHQWCEMREALIRQRIDFVCHVVQCYRMPRSVGGCRMIEAQSPSDNIGLTFS